MSIYIKNIPEHIFIVFIYGCMHKSVSMGGNTEWNTKLQ